ncbi:MAG TPA: FUSC family protein [Acidimicrobiales bacterium]|nr:FUSC family protein [Acidimicrobiales bacterium]
MRRPHLPAHWSAVLRGSLRIARNQVDVAAAVRNTVGVVVPLAVGIAAGSVANGLAAAIGALSGGFAAFQGTYRSRATFMLTVAVGMAVSTLVGALAQPSDAATIAVDGIWGVLAGMLVVLGPGALVVGLQWAVAVLVVSAFPMTPTQALVRAAMVLAGGVLQTLLVAALWPLQGYRAERAAVAAAYGSAAAYCRAVAAGGTLSAPDPAYDDARAVLRDPRPFGRTERVEAFGGLLDELGRARLHLAALGRLQAMLDAPTPWRDSYTFFLTTVAGALDGVADAMRERAEPEHPPPRPSPDVVVQALDGARPRWASTEMAVNVQMLAGQVRSAQRIAAAGLGTGEPVHGERYHRTPTARRAWLAAAGQTLVVNVSWNSSAFRHAVRLGLALAAAAAIAHLGGFARGYWIGLTALVILRPDFATTMVRGVSRLVGTMGGAVLATLLVAWLRPGTAGLTVLFAGSVLLGYSVVRANYLLFSICVTAYVVFLLAFARLPAITTVDDRVVDTLLGGGLALVVYLAWPTWESRLVGEQLARLLEAQRRYVAVLLAVFEDPASAARPRLEGLRDAARRERSNTETSLQRLAGEPARHRGGMEEDRATAVAAASRRLALGALTLHANLPPAGAMPLPALGGLARLLDESLAADAAHLRGDAGAAPVEPRRLRAEHEALRRALDGDRSPAAGLVLSETDLMVDAADSVTELLGQPAVTATGGDGS